MLIGCLKRKEGRGGDKCHKHFENGHFPPPQNWTKLRSLPSLAPALLQGQPAGPGLPISHQHPSLLRSTETPCRPHKPCCDGSCTSPPAGRLAGVWEQERRHPWVSTAQATHDVGKSTTPDTFSPAPCCHSELPLPPLTRQRCPSAPTPGSSFPANPQSYTEAKLK